MSKRLSNHFTQSPSSILWFISFVVDRPLASGKAGCRKLGLGAPFTCCELLGQFPNPFNDSKMKNKRERERERETDRQTDRQTETDRDRETETERDKDRDRETDTETERERKKEKKTD